MSHLSSLKPHQVDGYYAFEKWMQGLEPFANLIGVAGGGKTFSVLAYCQEYGLNLQEEVLGVAPTNTAAKQLSVSLGIPCSTIHKAFSLTIKDNKWDEKDDAEVVRLQDDLETLATEIDDSEDEDDRHEALKKYNMVQVILNKLEAKKQAFRKDELNFSTGESTIPSTIKLIIIDEGSMIAEDNFNTIVNNSPVTAKVLFLWDNLQLPPVGEMESKVGTTLQIAKFTQSVRNAGEIGKLMDTLREITNFRDAITLLTNTEPSDNLGHEPLNSVVWVSKSETKQLAEQWAKGYSLDGMDFRFISYRRNPALLRANLIKKFSGIPFYSQGDLYLANSVVSRTCLIKKQGSEEWKNYTPIVQNGFTVEGLNLFDTKSHYIVGENGKEYHFAIKRISFYMDEGECRTIKITMHPGQEFNRKREALPVPNILRLLPYEQLKDYREVLEFVTNCRSAFYGKGNKPQDGKKAEQFLASIGKESWKDVEGTPGFKYKGDGWSLSNDYRGKNFSHTEFTYWREIYNQKYNWLKSLVDDVQYPTASTTYKSQGNTIKRVVVDLKDYQSMSKGTHPSVLLKGLYTACSRASEVLYIYF